MRSLPRDCSILALCKKITRIGDLTGTQHDGGADRGKRTDECIGRRKLKLVPGTWKLRFYDFGLAIAALASARSKQG